MAAIITAEDQDELVAAIQRMSHTVVEKHVVQLQAGDCAEQDLTDPTGWADVIAEEIAEGVNSILYAMDERF